MKYLVLLLVIAIVYAAWRGQRRPPPRQGPTKNTRIAPPQDMVGCAHCGVHLPRSEALWDGGRSYCSRAHQERGPA